MEDWRGSGAALDRWRWSEEWPSGELRFVSSMPGSLAPAPANRAAAAAAPGGPSFAAGDPGRPPQLAPMVKVYGAARSWNIARVLLILEEAGVEYKVVAVDFAAAEHKSPAHLVRNPFGQVPVLEDGDFCLWESRAITKYICRKYKPEFLRVGNQELEGSAMVDVWMEVEAHHYSPIMDDILMEIRIRPIFGQRVDESAMEGNIKKLKKVREVYEARLSSSRYLAGDLISLADLNHVSTMLCLGITTYGSVLDAYPRVRA